VIINDINQYNKLVELTGTNTGIVAVIPSSTTCHPCISPVSFIYYMFLTGESFILGINHPDTTTKFPVVLPTDGYVIDKKSAMGMLPVEHLIDIESLFYASNVQFKNIDHHYTKWVEGQISMFINMPNLDINNSIPLSIWLEMYTKLTNDILSMLPKKTIASVMLNNIISTFSIIEKNGLYIDPTKYTQHFANTTQQVVDSKVYTNYNLFTQTGRPSNSFKGINFAALNKSDGSRSAFISRFGAAGALVQMDFDAYHLRLLAKAFGLMMPDESLHEVLAKQYYNTENITDEQYDEGKKKTFQLLYGNITPDENFPYLLKSIHNTRNKFWEDYKKYGYIESRYGGRKIVVSDPSISKVFNYYVQSLESEATYSILYKLVPAAQERGLLPVLYTYDSVLFDIKRDDLPLLSELINSLTPYPYSLSVGTTYDNLVEIG